MKNGPYYYVAVENFSPEEYEPTTEKIRVRPLPGQGIDQNARVECDRSHMRHNFSLGTVFIIKGKITDREDGPAFVYSYFGWPYITIPRETALQLIAEQKVGFFESALFNGFCEIRAFPIKFFKLGKSE